jgi:exosortase
LEVMAERWSNQAQYSHGFLVPVFAAAVLLLRRPDVLPAWRPAWPGAMVMGGAVGLRIVAAELDNHFLDGFALVAMLAGTVLLVAGRDVFRWAWPSIAYLGFMLPLPFALEVTLSHPLQRLATVTSTFALQTLGYPALAEGNIILIDQVRLGVIEACSGLGMLMTFFAISTAMALVLRGPLVDRIVVLVSAVPIAVVANVVRITATGIAYYHLGADSEVGRAIMHDLAGWLMMPLALALLWLEWCYLQRLFPAVERPQPVLGYGSAT